MNIRDGEQYCDKVETAVKYTAFAVFAAFILVLLGGTSRGWAEAPQVESTTQRSAEFRTLPGLTIRPDEQLTVDQCVQIALYNSPGILAASHTVGAARSRVGQAWAGYYPQITLAGTYTKRDMTNTIVPRGQDSYSGSATLTQNIIDFGRTGAQVSARLHDLDASREDLREVASLTAFNVKSAYYGLLRAEKNRDVLRETVTLSEKQLEQATGFYEAGVRSRFDVTNAEVELRNAKLNLIRAENALRIARVTLNNAMGLPDAPEYTIKDALSFQKYAVSLEEARNRAFLNRPDIRAAVARREAAEVSLSLARKGYYPTLSGNATYTRAGASYPPDFDIWSVGVTLTIPFFNGFLTTHQVREAKENFYTVKANEESLKQNVLLALQQAYFKMLESEELVGVAEITVKKAEENYVLAQGRYEAGVGSPIEETNALVTLSDARMNYIGALADYKVAEAELRRAMGE
jgi:outer membrane protein